MPGVVIHGLDLQLDTLLRQQGFDRQLNGVKLRVLAVVSQRQFGQPVRFGQLCQCAVVMPARQKAVGRRPIALIDRAGIAQQRNGVDQLAQPTANGRIGRQRRTLIEQQEITAFFQPAFQFVFAGVVRLQLDAGMHQFFGHFRQYPDIHLIDQRAVAKVIVKGVDFHLAAVVAHHAIRPGPHRVA
ncbi:hypothetical protein D3C78_1032600 [compost metagenome]